MLNNFMNIGHIVGEDGKAETQKTIEVLTMSCRGNEPREFKYHKLDELMVLIIMNYISYRFKENLNPNPKSLRLLLGIYKALTIYLLIIFFQVSL